MAVLQILYMLLQVRSLRGHRLTVATCFKTRLLICVYEIDPRYAMLADCFLFLFVLSWYLHVFLSKNQSLSRKAV